MRNEQKTPQAKLRVRVVVRGRVQGVAFRAHTADQARRAGVTGWVRNRPDGSVEAAFGGASRGRGAARVRAARPAARVDDVGCATSRCGRRALDIR